MIVQRKMADIKLKRHVKLCQEIVLFFFFVIHSCMNVTCHQSVYLCAWCCLKQTISVDLILQDRICSALVGEGRCLSASLCEAVSCYNHLKNPSRYLALGAKWLNLPQEMPPEQPNLSDSIKETHLSKLLMQKFCAKSKPKGQLLQISVIRRR